jgi:hypothetical protein
MSDARQWPELPRDDHDDHHHDLDDHPASIMRD